MRELDNCNLVHHFFASLFYVIFKGVGRVRVIILIFVEGVLNKNDFWYLYLFRNDQISVYQSKSYRSCSNSDFVRTEIWIKRMYNLFPFFIFCHNTSSSRHIMAFPPFSSPVPYYPPVFLKPQTFHSIASIEMLYIWGWNCWWIDINIDYEWLTFFFLHVLKDVRRVKTTKYGGDLLIKAKHRLELQEAKG